MVGQFSIIIFGLVKKLLTMASRTILVFPAHHTTYGQIIIGQNVLQTDFSPTTFFVTVQNKIELQSGYGLAHGNQIQGLESKKNNGADQYRGRT
jgi:hypothetical protein